MLSCNLVLNFTPKRVDIQNKIVAIYEDQGDFDKALQLQEKYRKNAEKYSDDVIKPKPKSRSIKLGKKDTTEIEEQKEVDMRERAIKEKSILERFRNLSNTLITGDVVD